MAGNLVNSSAINANDSFAAIVYLPDASVSCETVLYERGSPYLAGEMTFGITPSGDISKILTLTAPAITIDTVTTGTLNLSKTIYLAGSTSLDKVNTGTLSGVRYFDGSTITSTFNVTGSVLNYRMLSASLDWGFEPTANLIIQANIGEGSSTSGFITTGELTVKQVMAGISAITTTVTGDMQKTQYLSAPPASVVFAVSGDLTRNECTPRYFDLSGIDLGLEVTGSLQATYRMPGTAEFGMDMVGEMVKAIAMTGSIDCGFNLSGDLSNNAYGVDLTSAVMVRPYRKREMTR